MFVLRIPSFRDSLVAAKMWVGYKNVTCFGPSLANKKKDPSNSAHTEAWDGILSVCWFSDWFVFLLST